MKHLNTRFCSCGQEMTIYHKTGHLQPVNAKNFFGGNVKAFADATCPGCQAQHKLYLRQAKNAWHVVAIEPQKPGEVAEEAQAPTVDDEFELMERDELKAWLDGLGIEYTANWGDKRLRELCRGVVAAKEGEE